MPELSRLDRGREPGSAGVALRPPPVAWTAAAALLLLLLLAPGIGAEWVDPALPVIEAIRAPARFTVGRADEIRLSYRARLANVVAVIQVIEDVDGPLIGRATLQRELRVVAQAFGREAGELAIPVSFPTAGRKRVAFTLVTDGREQSETEVVYVEAVP